MATCTQYNYELQAILDRTLNYSKDMQFHLSQKRVEQLYKRLALRVGYIPEGTYERVTKNQVTYYQRRYR